MAFRASRFKIAADPRPVLMVFAMPGFHVEPDARPVKAAWIRTVRWPLIRCHKRFPFDSQCFRQRMPIRFTLGPPFQFGSTKWIGLNLPDQRRIGIDFLIGHRILRQNIGWISHVKTAHATAIAIGNHGERCFGRWIVGIGNH